MNYKNQLVLTGALNDVGAPIRMNVNESFRRGIELAANTIIKNKFNAQANLTWSQNKINEFNETIYDYTIGYDSIFIQHKNTDIAFSPQWIAAAAAGYTLQYGKKNHKLQFDLLGKYVGKQYLDNTQNEILSIDAYFIPDLKISTAISMRNYVHIDLALFIHNFTNQQYVTNGYTYSYIYEQRITERFYYPQAGRNYSLNLILKF
jgi:iron complex outermembrane receptor protein